MTWTLSQTQSRAGAALNAWKALPANGPLPTLQAKIDAGRELARVLESFHALHDVDPTTTPAAPVSDDVHDRICDVIDRVKLDDRQLDTDEYAGAIEQILADVLTARLSRIVVDPYRTSWSFTVEGGLSIESPEVEVVLDGGATRSQLIKAVYGTTEPPTHFTDLIEGA